MKQSLLILLLLSPLTLTLTAEETEQLQPDLLTRFREGEDVPMANVKQILFAVRIKNHEHWYANFGYYVEDENKPPYGWPAPSPLPGGKLGIYDLDTKEVRYILEDETGSIRDPQIHYNGEKVLFSYCPGETRYFHLFEINIDGTGLRQLTDGEFDDIEPIYTPAGNIIFVSSRAKRWVNCWMTQVAILYGCDGDGRNIKPLSGNIEHDNTPWMLPNGQVLYTRWEYVDRSQVDYHHLWTMNPDGTRQMVLYGNLHPGTVYIDAKPIPNSEKIVASFSLGHGLPEHLGYIGIIDPRMGPDDKNAAKIIAPVNKPNTPWHDYFRDPWAFSETAFLTARQAQMVLVDGDGNEQVIFELPEELKQKGLWLNDPRPVIRREPERIISAATNDAKSTGQLLLMDVYRGRNMEGVKRGEIKKLLILETLPKPANFSGGMEPLTYGGTFTLERIVGTVPVEPDGSANFELPATRGFFFVALDENDRAVKRMQSFLSVMPGEVTACIGCHEERTEMMQLGRVTTASRRPPSPITPVADYRGIDAQGNVLAVPMGIPDVIDFPRDIQPILDAHCVQCHSPEKREGGVSLIGDRSPLYSISYFTITAKTLVADGRNLAKSNYPPRTLGTGSSKLLDFCEESHYNVKLSDREMALVRLWIETGATYPGTYAGLGSGMVGGYSGTDNDRSDLQWPEIQVLQKTLQENCTSCHTVERNMQLPLSPSEEIDNPPWVPLRPNDVRRKFARHLLYNLSNPEKSTLLLGPLAKSAGGYESCGSVVLTGTDDPRYQAILSGIVRTKQHLDEIKRFDMPGFVPRPEYIREMERFGIIPEEQNPTVVVDVYDLDQKYWTSLWHVPEKK